MTMSASGVSIITFGTAGPSSKCHPLGALEIQPLEVHRRLTTPAVQQQERSYPIVRATLQHVEHRRNSRPRQILYPTHHALNPLDGRDRLAGPGHIARHLSLPTPTR